MLMYQQWDKKKIVVDDKTTTGYRWNNRQSCLANTFIFLGVYVKFDYVSIGYNTTHAKDTPNAIIDVY